MMEWNQVNPEMENGIFLTQTMTPSTYFKMVDAKGHKKFYCS